LIFRAGGKGWVGLGDGVKNLDKGAERTGVKAVGRENVWPDKNTGEESKNRGVTYIRREHRKDALKNLRLQKKGIKEKTITGGWKLGGTRTLGKIVCPWGWTQRFSPIINVLKKHLQQKTIRGVRKKALGRSKAASCEKIYSPHWPNKVNRTLGGVLGGKNIVFWCTKRVLNPPNA